MSIKHLTAKNLLTTQFYQCLADQQGQGLIEYVLLVSLLAITLIGSLISLKDTIYNVLLSIPFPGV